MGLINGKWIVDEEKKKLIKQMRDELLKELSLVLGDSFLFYDGTIDEYPKQIFKFSKNRSPQIPLLNFMIEPSNYMLN